MRSQFYCHIFLIKLAIFDIQQDVENFNCISSNIFFLLNATFCYLVSHRGIKFPINKTSTLCT
jgi:hypothetical protein